MGRLPSPGRAAQAPTHQGLCPPALRTMSPATQKPSHQPTVEPNLAQSPEPGPSVLLAHTPLHSSAFPGSALPAQGPGGARTVLNSAPWPCLGPRKSWAGGAPGSILVQDSTTSPGTRACLYQPRLHLGISWAGYRTVGWQHPGQVHRGQQTAWGWGPRATKEPGGQYHEGLRNTGPRPQ